MPGKTHWHPSEAHADYAGSLGYAISMTTIEPWLSQAFVKSGTPSVLQKRMDAFIRKQQSLKYSTTFDHSLPQITMVRSNDWKYYYDNENKIVVGTEDPDGGFFSVTWYPTELLITPSHLEVNAKLLQETSSLIPQGNMSVGNKTGKRFVQQLSNGEDAYSVILPYKNYLVSVVWYEGKGKKDKTKLDNLFQSFSVREESIIFSEQHRYEHSKPSFVLSAPRPWVLMALDNTGHPVSGQNQDMPEINYGVYVIEQSPGVQGATNEQYLDSIKTVIAGDFIGASRFTPKRYQSTSSYSINKNITQGIHYRYRFENEEADNKAEWFGAGCRIRIGDRVIAVILDYYGSDQKKFDAVVKQFEQEVLVGLSLTKSTTNSSSVLQNISKKKIVSKKGKALIGQILLRVEKAGEAWYVSPNDSTAYFLGSAEGAYAILRQQGIGIKTKDLSKIPIGLIGMAGKDTDGDGLVDVLEEAIGSDPKLSDTDGDNIDDKKEIEKGTFIPLAGFIRSVPDKLFVNKQKGKIFLQVEGKGEAWYVNPKDGKRYYLGRVEDAYAVMRQLSLGISENNFNSL